MIYFAHIVPKRSWMVWPIRYIGVLSTTLTYVLAPVVFAAETVAHIVSPMQTTPPGTRLSVYIQFFLRVCVLY